MNYFSDKMSKKCYCGVLEFVIDLDYITKQ